MTSHDTLAKRASSDLWIRAFNHHYVAAVSPQFASPSLAGAVSAAAAAGAGVAAAAGAGAEVLALVAGVVAVVGPEALGSVFLLSVFAGLGAWGVSETADNKGPGKVMKGEEGSIACVPRPSPFR